jgi:hypothetical protein
MLNQNNLILNKLVSLNNKIPYIITLNLVGDVVSVHCRDTVLQNIGIEKIMSNFTRIVTATSLLNFDNVKFLMYEEDNRKHVIINLQETSIIIGLIRETTVSDVLLIIGEFLRARQN